MYFGSPPRSIRGKRGASGLRDRRAELFCSPGVINTKGEGLLTLREEQVVKLVAEGIGNREIGQSLGIREQRQEGATANLRQARSVNRVEVVMYVLAVRGAGRTESIPGTRRALVALPIALSCPNSRPGGGRPRVGSAF